MSSRSDYIKDCLKSLRERDFKDHVATLSTYSESPMVSNGRQIQGLRWAKPGTCINSIDYLIVDGSLIVRGDLGAGVYTWGGKISLSFLATCDWHYMLGKLEGVERCRQDGEEWDPDVARFEFREQITEDAKERYDEHPLVMGDPQRGPFDPRHRAPTDCDGDIIEWEELSAAKREEYLNGYLEHIGLDIDCADSIDYREEWNRYLHDNDKGNDLNERFGDVGVVPNYRVLAHNLGLQMAYEQLKPAKEAA